MARQIVSVQQRSILADDRYLDETRANSVVGRERDGESTDVILVKRLQRLDNFLARRIGPRLAQARHQHSGADELFQAGVGKFLAGRRSVKKNGLLCSSTFLR